MHILSKYPTAFDYIDKFLIFLSATSGRVCIISSESAIEASAGIAETSFTLTMSLAIGIT